MAVEPEEFNLQWTAEQKRVIRQAAELKQKTLSAFILDQAYEAAKQILHDQDRYHFHLTKEQWREFRVSLNTPPKRLTALHSFMSTPSVLEKGEAK